MQLPPVPSRFLPANEKMETAMNDREFRKYLQEIAHGERHPVQKLPHAREVPAQKELPPKKVPDKAKRSTGKIAALKLRRKA
jgi:hypothetical protein